MIDTSNLSEYGFWPRREGQWFTSNADRYIFDMKLCLGSEGWQQYDTSQDAWYFGVWVHLEDRQVVTYAEGDLSIDTYDTAEAFRAQLKSMAEFYGDPPPAFTALGLDGSVSQYFDTRPTGEEPTTA